MLPRERIINALNHQESDKIPLDLGGTESTGFTAIAYNRLRKHLGMKPGLTPIFDVYQQVVKLEEDIRNLFQPDTIPVVLEPLKWKSFTLPDDSLGHVPDGWHPIRERDGGLIVQNPEGTITARLPRGGFYFEPAYTPLSEVEHPRDLKRYDKEIMTFDWPPFLDNTVDDLEFRAKQAFLETDLAVIFNLQLHILAAGQQLFGFERFMMDLLQNKRLVHAFFHRLVEAYEQRCDEVLTRINPYLHVILLNDDLGTQQGPMLSIDLYREMVWPYQKRLFQYIKDRADAYLLFHSCGSVNRFIPLLIEAGIDALNPIQVSASGMDSKDLKKEYGRDIVFWGGGCDTQRILPNGTKDEIWNEVERRIQDLAPGGGFIFSQVHNIQPDVPPENVMHMTEAFQAFRSH